VLDFEAQHELQLSTPSQKSGCRLDRIENYISTNVVTGYIREGNVRFQFASGWTLTISMSQHKRTASMSLQGHLS